MTSVIIEKELHRGASIAKIQTAAFWQALCPNLTVSTPTSNRGNAKLSSHFSQSDEDGYRQRMDTDGYFTLDFGPGVIQTANALAEGILRLDAAGWPSTFLLMYDEVWEFQRHVEHIMQKTTGNVANMDILAFLVDPNKGVAGFTPHRDRQPADVGASFSVDGSPKYSTCWLALKDATPENSCLYFIPRHADPGYIDGDGHGEHDDMMRDALCSKDSYQHIRAIPLRQGEAAFFSHRIIHWGSRGRTGYPHPRLALSFAFSSDDFEPPYINIDNNNNNNNNNDTDTDNNNNNNTATDNNNTTTDNNNNNNINNINNKNIHPDLAMRLCLAASQMLVYHERFEPDLDSLALYETLFKTAADRLDTKYRRKVQIDFISSVKDAENRRLHTTKETKPTKTPEVDVEEEDVLDDALDMMLDAVQDGYGDFDDDYVASDTEQQEGEEEQQQQHDGDVDPINAVTCNDKTNTSTNTNTNEKDLNNQESEEEDDDGPTFDDMGSDGGLLDKDDDDDAILDELDDGIDGDVNISDGDVNIGDNDVNIGDADLIIGDGDANIGGDDVNVGDDDFDLEPESKRLKTTNNE